MDEAQDYGLGELSKQDKRVPLIRECVAQLRRRGWDMWLITQNPSELNRTVQVKYEQDYVCIPRTSFAGGFKVRKDVAKQFEKVIKIPSSRYIYSRYNSAVLHIKQSRNWKPQAMAYGGLGFAILATLFAVYKVVNIFS
jgi:hypothetical protein